MDPKNTLGAIILLIVATPIAIFNGLQYLAGWRFYAGDYTHKWYRKTPHGIKVKEQEERLGL